MAETTAVSTPHATAITLIRTTALDEVAHHGADGDGPPAANWDMFDSLTATMKN
jgi:hypothetical protein